MLNNLPQLYPAEQTSNDVQKLYGFKYPTRQHVYGLMFNLSRISAIRRMLNVKNN